MYVRCHGCSRLFIQAWPYQLACKRACRQRAYLQRRFGLPRRAPDSCLWCGDPLVDTEHPTRRYCDGRCRTRAYPERLASRRTMLMSSVISTVILPGLGPCVPSVSPAAMSARYPSVRERSTPSEFLDRKLNWTGTSTQRAR